MQVHCDNVSERCTLLTLLYICLRQMSGQMERQIIRQMSSSKHGITSQGVLMSDIGWGSLNISIPCLGRLGLHPWLL